MGSPIASPIAELTLDDLLDDAVSACDVPPQFMKKYVDDLFLLLPLEHVDSVKNIFNSQHRNIQFTVELEKDGQLPFLDMVLHRHDGRISTDWYMKPIASGRFLNFFSFQPLHQKINVAINFAKRVNTFCKNSNKTSVRNVIRSNLRLNDYPTSLINRIINRLDKITEPQTAMEENETEPKIFRSLTNIDGLTSKITKTLRPEYNHIRTSSKQTKTVCSLLPIVKDKTPHGENTHVIYRIECKGESEMMNETEPNNECDACYIGCTIAKLKQRMSQHRTQTNELKRLWDIGYTDQDYPIQQLRQQTALLEHEVVKHHLFDIDNARIIDRANNQNKLAILESCHINTTKRAINIRKESDKIHPSYTNIFQSLEQIRNIKPPDQKHTNRNSTTPETNSH